MDKKGLLRKAQESYGTLLKIRFRNTAGDFAISYVKPAGDSFVSPGYGISDSPLGETFIGRMVIGLDSFSGEPIFGEASHHLVESIEAVVDTLVRKDGEGDGEGELFDPDLVRFYDEWGELMISEEERRLTRD